MNSLMVNGKWFKIDQVGHFYLNQVVNYGKYAAEVEGGWKPVYSFHSLRAAVFSFAQSLCYIDAAFYYLTPSWAKSQPERLKREELLRRVRFQVGEAGIFKRGASNDFHPC